jgi:hypothetical protein
MKLKELFNERFKGRQICWYPSAGDDFDAMGHWYAGHGNEITPSVFIYTDFAYSAYENNSISYGDRLSWPDDFLAMLPPLEIEDIKSYSTVLQFLDNAKDDLDEIVKKYKPGPDQDNALYEEYKSLSENGIIDAWQVIEKFDMNIQIPDARGLLLGNTCNGNLLLLLKTSNRIFYDFCVMHSISIPCIMIHRPDDDFIEAGEFDLNPLNVKEAFIGYLSNPAVIDYPPGTKFGKPFIWNKKDKEHPDTAFLVILP